MSVERLRLADEAMRMEEYSKAHSMYEDIVNLYRHEFNRHQISIIIASMAKCSNHLQYYERAIQEATLALNEDATCVIALKQRATSFFKLKNYERAQIDIQDSIALARK
ncbi:unnamed protein product [Rotaria sordida]|uniref:Uncharacterized protein n=1 Tax=Rotaria sordida TaxID=392033 RepID=A0A815B0W6_9BILA|nr:unnamed protein product [Rotaria sordida]CAF1261486.1 unnamed protein product [Rotaria sordida]